MDAAVEAVSSEPDGISTIKEEHKNSTVGFSLWTTCSKFTSHWLWQEFSEAPQHVAIDVTVTNVVRELFLAKSDWSTHSKFCLLFTNALYGLFPRWTRKINLKKLRNVPSDVRGTFPNDNGHNLAFCQQTKDNHPTNQRRMRLWIIAIAPLSLCSSASHQSVSPL